MSKPQALYIGLCSMIFILPTAYALADHAWGKLIVIAGVVCIGVVEMSYFRDRRRAFYLHKYGHGVENPKEFFAQFLDGNPFWGRFFVGWWVGVGFLAITLLTVGQGFVSYLESMPGTYLGGFVLAVFAPPLVPFLCHFLVKEREFYRSLANET